MRGFALNCTRGSQAMPRRVEGAKIALLDFNLQKHRLQLGVQVRAPSTTLLHAPSTPALCMCTYLCVRHRLIDLPLRPAP